MNLSTRDPWELSARTLDRRAGSVRRSLLIEQGRLLDSSFSGAGTQATSSSAGVLLRQPHGRARWQWTLPDDVWVFPGFVDSHTHLIGVGLAPQKPDLSHAESRNAALAQVAEWLARDSASTPLIAEGWDQSCWDDPALPTRAELDQIAPVRPLALRRVCGHIAVLNSAALQRLGTDWPDLDPDSGLAKETLPLALPRLWPPTEEQYDQAVSLGQREAWRRGVTQIHEMGHPGSWRAFGRADVAGTLHLRVAHFMHADFLEACESVAPVAGGGSERLRFGGIKAFLDGSFGGRSAFLRGEAVYLDHPGRGIALFTDDALAELMRRARARDLPLALHAIGDGAIEQIVRIGEQIAHELGPWTAPAPRIEHAEMLDAELIARAAALGFWFSMQPNFTARWQGLGELYEQALGPRRANHLNPYRSAADTGRLCFGSDTMPLDPLLGLRGAMRHPNLGERLPLLAALEAYTRGGAAALRRPFGWSDLGSGDGADLVGLRWPALTRLLPDAEALRNLDTPDLLDDVEVALTVVGGEIRFLGSGLLGETEALQLAPEAVR